jgi:outer membrane lipoprotein-sorting protein
MIPRRAFLATCSVLGAALLSRRALASTPEVLASLRTARQRIRTLQARFEQERTLGLLATKVVSRGELTVVLPGQLRWELLPPDAITWWITPAGLAYASSRSRASADRSAAGPMAGVLDDVLVVLGGDPARLEPRYALEATLQPDETARVVATPKDSRISAVLRSIEILIDRDLISPRRIRMEESSSDRIEIRFSDVRINQPVDPARMRPAVEPRP